MTAALVADGRLSHFAVPLWVMVASALLLSLGTFLPKSPDLIGLLVRRGEVAIEGMDAFATWSRGDRSQSETLRRLEHRADLANREVLTAIRSAFVTPIDPEDVYEISERLDGVLNSAKNLVREAELLDMDPDERWPRWPI